jgi:hypothetical protein
MGVFLYNVHDICSSILFSTIELTIHFLIQKCFGGKLDEIQEIIPWF